MTTATKTKPQPPATLSGIADNRRQAAYDRYFGRVRDTASDKPMGPDDAEQLYDCMRELEYPIELFDGDVETLRQRNEMRLVEFDHTADDAEDEKLLKLLEDREAQRKNKITAPRREIAMTTENAERLAAEAGKSILIRNRIIQLLQFESHRRAGDGYPGGIIPAKAREIDHEKLAIDQTLRLARTLEQCNPRIFAGDRDDRREAWDTEACRQAINDPDGLLLRGRTQGRDVTATPKAAMPVKGFTANNPATKITPTPYAQ